MMWYVLQNGLASISGSNFLTFEVFEELAGLQDRGIDWEPRLNKVVTTERIRNRVVLRDEHLIIGRSYRMLSSSLPWICISIQDGQPLLTPDNSELSAMVAEDLTNWEIYK